ncbi:MAG: class I SAM-dependent methyltransferase [Halioglobus sp.]
MANPKSATELTCPFGRFTLTPHSAGPTPGAVQAWCAADKLLLNAVANATDQSSGRTFTLLTINDTHGAISVPAAAEATWTDSALSCEAILRNAQANSVEPPAITPSTLTPPCSSKNTTHVLIRVPKQHRYFEYQLEQIALHFPAGTPIYAAGMDKHLSPHTATIMEKYIGAITRHRGESKARLFTGRLEKTDIEKADFSNQYFCEPLEAPLLSLPNVFSQSALDQGTRFLLETLSALEPAEHVIDLACGNGVLGIYAGKYGGASVVTFCDESALAIASARHNVATVLGETKTQCSFDWSNGLQDYKGPKVERILLNPPFHAGHRVDPGSGKRLLSQCAEHLKSDGELLVVANRHLDYLATLEKTFRRVSSIAQNKKFVVLRAMK